MSDSVFKSGKFWIGIAISALFLYVAFRGIDFQALLNVISRVNPWWILAAIGLYIFNLCVRAIRWQYIFRHVKPVKFRGMLEATLVGYFANNVLPMRLGEVARAVYVGQREGCDKSASLGTIAVERIFDVLMAVVVLAITFVVFPFPEEVLGEWTEYFKIAGQGFVIVSAVGFITMFVMVKKRDWTLKLIDRILSFLPDKGRKTAGRLAHSFIDGLAILSSPLELLVLFVLTAAVWLTNLWPIYVSGLAFAAPGMKFGAEDQLFLLTAGAVAAAIPASPGFVGTFHFVTKKAVEIILIVKFAEGGIAATGIDPALFGEWGLSFAVLIHGLYILTTTTSGAIIFMFSGVSFRSLKNEAQIVKNEEE